MHASSIRSLTISGFAAASSAHQVDRVHSDAARTVGRALTAGILPCGFVGALLLCTATAKADISFGLYGTGAGSVYTINTADGAGALVGPAGHSFNNLAYDSSTGMLLAESGLSGGFDELFTIDPSTGSAKALTQISGLGTYRTVFGLAFSNTGTLYAVGYELGSNVPSGELFTIDPVSGAATALGSETDSLVDIAWDPVTNTLYGWNTYLAGRRGLVTINTSTGADAPVAPGIDNLTSIQALAFDAKGNLYGARDSLYSVNPTDGTTTLVGQIRPTSADLRGLAFAPTAVPEPAMSAMLVFDFVGLLLLLVRRRRSQT